MISRATQLDRREAFAVECRSALQSAPECLLPFLAPVMQMDVRRIGRRTTARCRGIGGRPVIEVADATLAYDGRTGLVRWPLLHEALHAAIIVRGLPVSAYADAHAAIPFVPVYGHAWRSRTRARWAGGMWAEDFVMTLEQSAQATDRLEWIDRIARMLASESPEHRGVDCRCGWIIAGGIEWNQVASVKVMAAYDIVDTVVR